MYVTNTKRLTNDGAKKMMATAIEKAKEAGIAVSVAITATGSILFCSCGTFGHASEITIQTELQTSSMLRGGDSRLSRNSLRLRGYVSLFLRRPSTGIFGGFSGLSGPHN